MARKISPKGVKPSFKDTKVLWAGVIILALVIAYGVFAVINNLIKQETYYVLSHSMSARTQVTEGDLTAVTTSAGSAPANAIPLSEVQQGTIYTKYPLNQNDVLEASSAGPLDSLNEGIPDNWVITSFNIDATNAVSGILQRGDYFDMLVLGDKKASKDDSGTAQSGTQASDIDTGNVAGRYVFRNVMLLDTPTSSQQTGGDSANGATAQTTSDTTDYVVGMSPKNVAILHSILSRWDVRLVVSPKQTQYANPSNLDALYKSFDFDQEINDLHKSGIIASDCVDSSTGNEQNKDCTDNTFTPQERDSFGVPFNAKDDERDATTGDPKPLTAFEKTWCAQLFTDDYYNNSKWAEEKKYCTDNGFKKEDASKYLDSSSLGSAATQGSRTGGSTTTPTESDKSGTASSDTTGSSTDNSDSASSSDSSTAGTTTGE